MTIFHFDTFRRKFWAVALLVIIQSPHVQAQDGTEKAEAEIKLKSTTGTVWIFDSTEIKITKTGTKRIWVRGEHASDETVKYAKSRFLYEIDCEDDKARTLASVLYAANDSTISAEEFPEFITPMKFIVPGTMLQELARQVCSI